MINTIKCEMNSRERSVYVCVYVYVIRGFVFQHRSVDSAQVPYDDYCAASHFSVPVLVVFFVELIAFCI